MVERGCHPSLAVQVLSARARDYHTLAGERALGADFVVEYLQALGSWCESLGRCQREEPPGLLVVLGNAAELVN